MATAVVGAAYRLIVNTLTQVIVFVILTQIVFSIRRVTMWASIHVVYILCNV